MNVNRCCLASTPIKIKNLKRPLLRNRQWQVPVRTGSKPQQELGGTMWQVAYVRGPPKQALSCPTLAVVAGVLVALATYFVLRGSSFASRRPKRQSVSCHSCCQKLCKCENCVYYKSKVWCILVDRKLFSCSVFRKCWVNEHAVYAAKCQCCKKNKCNTGSDWPVKLVEVILNKSLFIFVIYYRSSY